VCLLRGTDWIFMYNSTFCPHSAFMCFVWIWEQTGIISLYLPTRSHLTVPSNCTICYSYSLQLPQCTANIHNHNTPSTLLYKAAFHDWYMLLTFVNTDRFPKPPPPPKKKFLENQSSNSRHASCGRTDRQTGMTNLITVTFRNFANAPKVKAILMQK